MNVLLIGGTGTLSSDTAQLCINRGFDVYLINRGHKNTYKGSNVHYLIGDINQFDSASKALKDESFDVVVDYLVYTLETLKKHLAILKNRARQYIFISSATVYPIQDGVVKEGDTIGNDGWVYAKNKRFCEEYLRKNAKELTYQYTIVRPYITYDRKRIPFPIISKKSCWNLLYRISNGYPILMPGDGNQKVTLTSTIDFAVGIVGLFMNQDAYGEDFNIVGDSVATWNEVVGVIEKKLGKKANIVYVETEKLADKLPVLAGEIIYDKANSHFFNNEKIKRIVPEFRTTLDVETGIGRTVDYLMSSKEIQIVDEYWNAFENVLCNKYGEIGCKVSLKQRWQYFKAQSKLAIRVKKALKIDN